MRILLFQSSKGVLPTMSDQAGEKGKEYLEDLGVEVIIGQRIVDFDGSYAYSSNGDKIRTNNVVWAAGIKTNKIEGLEATSYSKSGRLIVDSFNQIKGYDNIFAIGDLAEMINDKYPYGHPQVAQPAIQQGKLLGKNLIRLIEGKSLKKFKYKDKGSMATVGRNKAVVDLKHYKFAGFFAWFVWMFIHLMALVGFRNRVVVFFNWCYNYINFDKAARLIIRPFNKLN